MQNELQNMWMTKLGLRHYDQGLTTQLLQLLERSEVDYTIFFP
jgi:uncharacterized protein YdiU (UPF0061 family)